MEAVKPNLSQCINKQAIPEEEKPKKNLIQLQKESDSKPFPVLLGPLKRFLQEDAQTLKKNSLHAYIKEILKEHAKSRGWCE